MKDLECSRTPHDWPPLTWSLLYPVASWKLKTTCFLWLVNIKVLLADNKSQLAGAPLLYYIIVKNNVWLSSAISLIIGGLNCCFSNKLVYTTKFFSCRGSLSRSPVMRCPTILMKLTTAFLPNQINTKYILIVMLIWWKGYTATYLFFF